MSGENEQGDRWGEGEVTEYDAEYAGGGFQGSEEGVMYVDAFTISTLSLASLDDYR